MVRLTLHLLCLIPLAWLVYGAFTATLGPDPQDVLLHELGIWSLRILLVSLAITPLRLITRKPQLTSYRRLFGLYFAVYLTLHFITYLTFNLGFDLSILGEDIIDRPYITVGMAAMLLTIPLVVTSTKGWQRRLARRWKQLHNAVYPIAFVGL